MSDGTSDTASLFVLCKPPGLPRGRGGWGRCGGGGGGGRRGW